MALHPPIAKVMAALQAHPGTTRVFMSGSGATCVALSDEPLEGFRLPPKWWWAQTMLR